MGGKVRVDLGNKKVGMKEGRGERRREGEGEKWRKNRENRDRGEERD